MTKKRPFDEHPAFYQEDNRRNRYYNPTSKAFLEAKFNVLLPENYIRDKKILDLGACYGAAGQWALFYDAAHYTGIEIQPEYIKKSRQLLSHWGNQAEIIHQDIRSYLLEATDNTFDIVLLAGVLYHFIDTKEIIDQACRISREQVIIESNYPPGMRSGKLPLDTAITEYILDQEVNLDSGNQSMLGVSATTSISALDILFRLNSFSKTEDKLAFPLKPEMAIYDENALGETNSQARFAVRYFLDNATHLSTLENHLSQQSGKTRSWDSDPVSQARTQQYQKQARRLRSDANPGDWKFDAQVAEVFDGIARREIPDYLRVIDLCIRLIQKDAKDQPKIIDVGSATGETLRQLHQAGFTNLYGVDASKDMLAKSFDKAILIHSDSFPEDYGVFDYVLNNWTLHFIPRPLDYLKAIQRSLVSGGTLILTDKVSSSERTLDLYHDYKRANGVTESEIELKRQQIEGILTTHTITWYLNTLFDLGFEQVEIINASASFVTFMAVKPDS